MAIFGKNPNEVAFTGGKKHIIDVIKNTGRNDLLIWRQPEEDFNYNSTLVVMPGESAIFVKNGKIEQVFNSPGRYLLKSQNYPFLSRLTNKASGGISSYNSVVYFIRSADSQEIFWGTQTPIDVRDKIWGVVTAVRARGSYKISISDPEKFLNKLLGSNKQFETQDGLDDYFASEFQSKIKSTISKNLNNLETEIIGIDAMMDDISQELTPKIRDILQNYGLKCENFNISALDVDKEKYQQFDNSQMAMYKKKMEAMGDLAQMQALGDNWEKLKQYNIMEKMVSNPSPSLGTGMGMMGAEIGISAAAGNMISQMAQQTFQPISSPAPAPKAASDDPFEVLSKLQKMYEMGLIDKNEYDDKKKEVLSRL